MGEYLDDAATERRLAHEAKQNREYLAVRREADRLRARVAKLKEALRLLLDDAETMAHASFALTGTCSPPTDKNWRQNWEHEDPEGFAVAQKARAALDEEGEAG